MGEGANQTYYDEIVRSMNEVLKDLEKNNKSMAKIGAAVLNYLISYDDVTRGMDKAMLKDLKKNTDELERKVRETLEYSKNVLNVKEK
jgi:hypothetical protein